jgi:hypothetical protein
MADFSFSFDTQQILQSFQVRAGWDPMLIPVIGAANIVQQEPLGRYGKGVGLPTTAPIRQGAGHPQQAEIVRLCPGPEDAELIRDDEDFEAMLLSEAGDLVDPAGGGAGLAASAKGSLDGLAVAFRLCSHARRHDHNFATGLEKLPAVRPVEDFRAQHAKVVFQAGAGDENGVIAESIGGRYFLEESRDAFRVLAQVEQAFFGEIRGDCSAAYQDLAGTGLSGAGKEALPLFKAPGAAFLPPARSQAMR